MAAEAALRQAEVEGLTLVRSEESSTGYKGVCLNKRSKSLAYIAKVWRRGKIVLLGSFATAEEAALSYARSPEAKAEVAAAATPPLPQMTAEEALRRAEAQGLTLLRSEDSNSGYKYVVFSPKNTVRPYTAKVWRGGKQVSLGSFATAEEAALKFARTREGRAAAAAAAAPPEPPPMTAEEALRLAEEEGLTLVRAEGSTTSYKNVSFLSRSTGTPFLAQVYRRDTTVTLGSFATAEEAALVVARRAMADVEARRRHDSWRKRKREEAGEDAAEADEGNCEVVIIDGIEVVAASP